MSALTFRRFALMAGTAMAALAVSPASAQTADRTAALEQRVKQLEEALLAVRGELEASRKEAAASSNTPRVQEAKSASGSGGLQIGTTTVKLGGYIKADAMVSDYSAGDTATNSLGRDFYLPQSIPVGAGSQKERADFDAHTKQTRLILTTSTPIGGKTLGAHVEADFQTSPGTQGSERTTNGYNLALRRAFMSYGDWTIGQDWTNFQNVGALPETTDFIGPTEGTVFVRQMQVRFARKLTDTVTLALSLENPETSSIMPANAALVESDDDSLPDAVAKLTFKPKFGEFTLAALGRQLAVDTPAANETAFGWGVSFAGKVPFGPGGRHDIRFMLTHGSGVGRYVGLNFAPDAVYVPTSGQTGLETVDVTAGFVAARFGLTAKLRSTLAYSFQEVDYPSGLVPGAANDQARSYAINLFYSPVKSLDLGIEYRHGERELVNGDKGKLDRVHVVAKQSF